jgi:deazaflavin-dependent oxidoreductase (nitroreductase family)
MARLFRGSVVTVLTVPGRRTGQRRTASVVVLDHDGTRYLVSAYGDTEWSRNLRSAGHGTLTNRGHTEAFHAVEVPVAERPQLIEQYLHRFGSFPTVRRTFAALPDPADHPTFRITGEQPA